MNHNICALLLIIANMALLSSQDCTPAALLWALWRPESNNLLPSITISADSLVVNMSLAFMGRRSNCSQAISQNGTYSLTGCYHVDITLGSQALSLCFCHKTVNLQPSFGPGGIYTFMVILFPDTTFVLDASPKTDSSLDCLSCLPFRPQPGGRSSSPDDPSPEGQVPLGQVLGLLSAWRPHECQP